MGENMKKCKSKKNQIKIEIEGEEWIVVKCGKGWEEKRKHDIMDDHEK